METKRKIGLLSLVLTTAMMFGCSSTGTVDGAGANAQGAAGAQGADVNALGEDAAIEKKNLVNDADAAAKMLTVYYFDFDQATLSAETRDALNVAASILSKTNNSIRLEGHADERGTREYNLALGERRAKAIANYLSLQGVSSSRIEVISYGEEKPVNASSNESAWAKNRRVELVK